MGTFARNLMRSYDPTRTTALRDAFVREINRRFASFRKALEHALVEDDLWGLGKNKVPRSLAAPGAFAFATSAKKAASFRAYVDELARKYVLTGGKAGVALKSGPARAISANLQWTDLYVDAAYRQGIRRALVESAKIGKKHPILKNIVPLGLPPTSPRAIDFAFMAPMHVDRAGLIYSRTYEDLQGIAKDMSTRMGRSFSESMMEGRDPFQTARIMLSRVPELTGTSVFQSALQRARTIARTEMIRAHHVANVTTYAEAGVEGVAVVAEWLATKDDKVCDTCEEMNGKRFSLDEILPLIPAHPNCRCCAIPVPLDEKGNPLVGKAGQEAAAESEEEDAA